MNKKIQVWLNTHIWPFTRISDLEQAVDEAYHKQDTAERDLAHLASAFGKNIEIVLADMHPEDFLRPVQIFTGVRGATSSFMNPTGASESIVAETYVLTPKIIKDVIEFDPFMMMSEHGLQYSSDIIKKYVAQNVTNLVLDELEKTGLVGRHSPTRDFL